MKKIKHKKTYFLLGAVIILFIVGSYKLYKYNIQKTETAKEIEYTEKAENTEEGYNNGFFTKELYESITEIYYWNGDTKITIDSQDDIDSIYKLLASLYLSNIEDNELEGGIIIELITNDETIDMDLFSSQIRISTGTYSFSDNIIDEIRNIVVQ